MVAKLRVLMLCGYTQNAFIFDNHTKKMQRACPEVEFDIRNELDVLNSPLVFDDHPRNKETTARAWWKYGSGFRDYLGQGIVGLDDTVEYMFNYLTTNPPFDGVFGFSQGSVLAALIANPKLHPKFPASTAISPFKFLITCGSYVPYQIHDLAPQFAHYFPLPTELVTLHILGKNDIIVVEENTHLLASKCLNSRVESHEGGHFVPCKASWRAFFNAYLTSFLPGGQNGRGIPPPIAFQSTHRGWMFCNYPNQPSSPSSATASEFDTSSLSSLSSSLLSSSSSYVSSSASESGDSEISHEWSLSLLDDTSKARSCRLVGDYLRMEKARFRL
ncbi:hypothetical protein CI109_100911 [Kwoniella shandongensis]|uniref:Uncharacterized protein n=1 Tax=Kwoniella shandongensis TaxID=1734106 RepID=A0A5M6C994_9TREE|nr:uncharacterized protein CI109_001377 [Kwoniella shandongensis]KAA5529975.1 hypothetical protein CI109_001377 [Kwoniella shandongensis]